MLMQPLATKDDIDFAITCAKLPIKICFIT